MERILPLTQNSIGYEPWHYRYVGPEAAERMYRDKLCLEEYLDTLPSPAP